ncbi:hypothetical protein MKX01_037115 [Papaver californicum]|nr:hypothetical protein MKX01_037115 [Papaver californicum]
MCMLNKKCSRDPQRTFILPQRNCDAAACYTGCECSEGQLDHNEAQGSGKSMLTKYDRVITIVYCNLTEGFIQ